MLALEQVGLDVDVDNVKDVEVIVTVVVPAKKKRSSAESPTCTGI